MPGYTKKKGVERSVVAGLSVKLMEWRMMETRKLLLLAVAAGT